MTMKPRLLVLSHVLPFPPTSGQRMRVRHTLRAARERFHVTFVAPVAPSQRDEAARKLEGLCDEAILLPRRWTENRGSAAWHVAAGTAYALATGLKRSNYAIGSVELSPARVSGVLEGRDFDCALIEYWHATPAVRVLRQKGIPCLLDMHDVLWRSYARQLDARRGLPGRIKSWAVRRYRSREEDAWREYDGVTAINEEEFRYVRERGLPASTRVFCAPMGVELERWPFQWNPVEPRRLAFYGGFAGAQNQAGARRCVEAILPAVRRKFPDAELWLIGSEPPEWLRRFAVDPGVRVTGFVEDVAPLLATMTAVLCPWSGTYGFRSRLVEVMAVGAPVVASPDAVDGMAISEGEGVLLGDTDDALAAAAIRLMESPSLAAAMSRAGREKVESLYGLDQTYGRWMAEVFDWLPRRQRMAS
jgi:glycosyltransferase involved in cell wall biosynthesis